MKKCVRPDVGWIQHKARIHPMKLTPRLASLNIGGLLTLGALHHFEGNLLTFLQGLEAAYVDRGEMREQILAAIIGSNETKTLCIVEPLYCTACHV